MGSRPTHPGPALWGSVTLADWPSMGCCQTSRCLQELDWTGTTHLAVELGKLCMPVRKGCDLCWAHESEVQGVEEQHHILALQSGWVGQEQNTECPSNCRIISSCRYTLYCDKEIVWNS